MPTWRSVIRDAMRALKAIAPGDDPSIDELSDGLVALQDVVLELHEARGPLRDVDVPAPLFPCDDPPSPLTYVAGENQRIRIQSGFTVTVTVPNAIAMYDGFDPYDYGFDPATNQWSAYVPQGTTGPADNIQWRQPHDGARIEIVGTTQQLFFYRADINQWVSAYDLRLDGEVPVNGRYRGSLGTLLAERLMEALSVNEPSPGFAKRAVNARAILFNRVGVHRSPVHTDYF